MIICSINVIPSKNPMFHMNEIDEGEGRSKSALFTIFRIGFFFSSWFFIRMMRIPFDWGGVHESIRQL